MLISVNLSKHTDKTEWICADAKIKIWNPNINPLIFVTWLRWRSLQGNFDCHGSGKHPPLGILASPQPSHDWRSLWTSWGGNPNTFVCLLRSFNFSLSLLTTTYSQVICMWLQRLISHKLTLAFVCQHSFLVQSPHDHVALPWTSHLEIPGSVKSIICQNELKHIFVT